MTTLHKAAQQALEALERYRQMMFAEAGCRWDAGDAAITALRTALAQQAEPVQEPDLSRCPQCGGIADNGHDRSIPPNPYLCTKCMAEPAREPVAWYQKRGQEVLTSHPACWGREDEPWTPLYTAPPQRQPLTEEEIRRICDAHWSLRQLARAVERAHGIGEKQ